MFPPVQPPEVQQPAGVPGASAATDASAGTNAPLIGEQDTLTTESHFLSVFEGAVPADQTFGSCLLPCVGILIQSSSAASCTLHQECCGDAEGNNIHTRLQQYSS